MPNITKYYKAIAKEKQQGADNEQNLRPHFYELLKHYLNSEGLHLQYEQREKSDLFNNYPDAKISREQIPVGHIENKDAKDNLNQEITKKLDGRGYPSFNILFENTERAVLYQAGKKVDEIAMNDAEELHRVLLKFVQYQTDDQKAFLNAKQTLKIQVPLLADEMRRDFVQEEITNKAFEQKLNEFLELCQKSINQNLEKEDVLEIVIQHILTEDIFIQFFSDNDFHKENTISRTVDELMQTLGNKKRDIKAHIQDSIISMKNYIHQMSKEDKKDVLKIFYEDFYTALNNKKADIQGVVYTPLAIVRFMIEATDDLLYTHFTKNLGSKGVKILDPCTGTGIFMSELIERLPKKDLAYKYEHELFVNEIDILPYYIANLNIEYSYREMMDTYKSFENICLIDTLEFQTKNEDGQLFGIASFSGENLERAIRQYDNDISVVIGNPPYNANQQSENHNNKNKVYSTVDQRIKDTYIEHSTAQKTKQFDMYKRFIRWASDRIKDHGMISFITNNAYLDARQDDGFRKCLQSEFDYVYIYDLGGNVRKNAKLSGTKNNVFGIQVGVSIVFLIKKSNVIEKKAKIYYTRMPELATAKDKLFELSDYTGKFEDIPFEQILPKDNGQWLNQTDNDFDTHPALINKTLKQAKAEITKTENVDDEKMLSSMTEQALFKTFSLGVNTARDSWAYDKNPIQLENKVQKLVTVYNKEREIWNNRHIKIQTIKVELGRDSNIDKKERKAKIQELENTFQIKMNKSLDYSIKWSEHIKLRMIADREMIFDKNHIRKCLYRPFCQSHLYFDSSYVDRVLLNPKLYPKGIEGENICINWDQRVSGGALASSQVVDLHFHGDSIAIPLYSYDESGNKTSNVTDWGLALFRDKYGKDITPEGLMQYCYAVLSSPNYQEKYADNLKTDYPRIPMYDDEDRMTEGRTTFEFYRSRGERLISLHADYMNVSPSDNLTITRDDDYLPTGIENPNKNGVTHPMKIDKKNGVLILDNHNKIENIPLEVFDYKIGSRSALDWIVEYHKPKKLNPEKELHHATLINEGLDTYDWKTIRAYLFDLVPKIVAVSLETLEIYGELDKK